MRLLVAFFPMLIVAALPWTCTALAEQDSGDLENHIWALEDTYVTAYKNADHDAILALMHERFLGWPDSEDMPTAYLQVPGFLKEKYGVPGTWDFKIDRVGIRIQGDVAITHYVLITTASDAGVGDQAQATRITHTWIREGPDWKILGGMSNVR
jgi:ketosteroid isomerase-like protein